MKSNYSIGPIQQEWENSEVGQIQYEFFCLRGHNWVHFAYRPQCTVTFKSNFTILKSESVSILSKRIIWAYSFEKKSSWVLALVLKSIFLRDRSLSDFFTVKKCKIVKGNPYLTENQVSKTKISCSTDNYNDMCHICGGSLDSSCNWA